MGRWNSETIIGTVDFSLCKVTLIEGYKFASTMRGNVARAAGGAPRAQTFDPGPTNDFGLSMVRANSDQITEALEEIRAAEAAQSGFRVRAVDALYTVDVIVLPDYNTQWLTHGPESEGIIEDLTWRFV